MATVELSKSVAGACSELMALQKKRAAFMKSRIGQMNRLKALVAGYLGYTTRMSEKERSDLYENAGKLIAYTNSGDASTNLDEFIFAHMHGINSLQKVEKDTLAAMVGIAQDLPVVSWIKEPEQKGFGIASLATVIGETGDLCNYATVSKVWRRLGQAPYKSKDGETHMGSTWRKTKKSSEQDRLTAAEWTDYGYSPRRRSVMYVIEQCLSKQNGDGPYRRRWLEAKTAAFSSHPEWKWVKCKNCANTAKIRNGVCMTCDGIGFSCAHANNHGSLLMGKLLIKNLWIVWTQ